ncbi:MAG TPA: toll/interleukin-1 receptor domain-containing protein [Xanthobacteraceae bacterium]|jgi:hypothetical protein|nr:toll/interleukin-1 receptor domain-containing protein [Xanthobacteraceae bacterium]
MSKPASNADHLFICYSSKDSAAALGVVDSLEAEGLRCWISARDVPPGQNYQETIVHALEGAYGLIFLFSDESARSGEIRKELSIAGSLDMPVYPLRLSPVLPTGALRYELATRQWIDLFPDRTKGLRKLVETIRKGDRAGSDGATMAASAPAVAVARAREPERAPILAADSKEFEAVRTLLARHVGPIAKVLIEKATADARTPEDLCARLATHVRAETDRAAFLKAARAQLAAKA